MWGQDLGATQSWCNPKQLPFRRRQTINEAKNLQACHPLFKYINYSFLQKFLFLAWKSLILLMQLLRGKLAAKVTQCCPLVEGPPLWSGKPTEGESSLSETGPSSQILLEKSSFSNALVLVSNSNKPIASQARLEWTPPPPVYLQCLICTQSFVD